MRKENRADVHENRVLWETLVPKKKEVDKLAEIS
jgi:hypothetical protein